MKRILSLVLALTLICSFSGCSFFEKEEETFDVTECLLEVEALVEAGELEAAEKLLKKGIRKAEDPEELEIYLELVQEMMAEENASGGESVPVPDSGGIAQQPTGATEPTETTQQPTGTIEQEIPYGKNLLTGFDQDDTYQINVFLSNFSEQNFQGYPCDDLTMVKFGYAYAKVNNREVVGADGYEYYISKANMDSILKRFFARTASVEEGYLDQGIRYTDGAYRFLAADGASCSYCSVATGMMENGDGTYTVTFDVYAHVNPHESMSQYYYMTPSQISGRSDVYYLYSGRAVVQDYIRSNGAESYQLLSYSR